MSSYDADGCAKFVAPFSETKRANLREFFRLLVKSRKMNTLDIERELGWPPTTIGAKGTTSIRKRARELSWELPYEGGLGEEPYGGISSPASGDDPERTYYIDRDGNARALLEALG